MPESVYHKPMPSCPYCKGSGVERVVDGVELACGCIVCKPGIDSQGHNRAFRVKRIMEVCLNARKRA